MGVVCEPLVITHAQNRGLAFLTLLETNANVCTYPVLGHWSDHENIIFLISPPREENWGQNKKNAIFVVRPLPEHAV